MSKHKKKNSTGKVIGYIFLALAALVVLIAILLRGNNVALVHTKGLIAHEQLGLMFMAAGIMLVLAVPALFLLYFIAWKYRESNARTTHDPNVRHSRLLDVSMWLVPSIFAVVLAAIMWPATHKLEPSKAIAADVKPLTIQVVAMRWKWLFIYPEQHIASVNFVQIPEDTPVQFELTADEAPMSSFWIPNLGGMLYAMTGHSNRLHLVADTPGDYPGSSAEINGAGFAGMQFIARATSQGEFDHWVSEAQLSGDVLNSAEYQRLLKPSENNPITIYSAAGSDLYDTVLMKYMGPSGGHTHHE